MLNKLLTILALLILVVAIVGMIALVIASLPPSPGQVLHNCLLVCEEEFGVGCSLHRACVEGCQRAYEDN